LGPSVLDLSTASFSTAIGVMGDCDLGLDYPPHALGADVIRPASFGQGNKPVIELKAGETERIVDEIEEALILSDRKLIAGAA
jgi:hypothetical protein